MIHYPYYYNVGKVKHLFPYGVHRELLFLFFYSLRVYLRQFIAIDKRAVLQILLVFSGVGTDGVHGTFIQRTKPLIGFYLLPRSLNDFLIVP